MPSRFHNVVLTGACGGLGQALARGLLAQGSAVALVGLQHPVLRSLAALAPGRTAIYTPDVADSAAMQAMAEQHLLPANLSTTDSEDPS